jgi:hypothetical protein
VNTTIKSCAEWRERLVEVEKELVEDTRLLEEAKRWHSVNETQ